MGAPNLWILMPDQSYAIGVVTGLLLAAIVACSIACCAARFQRLDPHSLLLTATVCLAVMPFVLPKMHERYWFPSELFAIGLAFAFPRLIFVPILLQASALQTYAVFLLDLQGSQKAVLIYSAVLINTLTIGALGFAFFRSLSLGHRRRSTPTAIHVP
jgi:Gpi18-like mannosyltransferase